MPGTLRDLNAEVVSCRKCPRLVAWREEVAVTKRAAYKDESYWGRPVPGFGDPEATVLVVGLAPAAHGANRTGRMFTGDRSGDWLYASLYRCGFANQPVSRSADDGLRLDGIFITASVRCAPPANKPLPEERANCSGYLRDELQLFRPQVIVALGGIAWDTTLRVAGTLGWAAPRPKPRFGHGSEFTLGEATVVGCYHPSQQNTFTGRLTEEMTDDVFRRAADLSGRRS